MTGKISNTSVIIVTYNSEKFIGPCMDSINRQSVQPHQIIISDTGSKDLSYLDQYRSKKNVDFVSAGKDVGFCKGNNAAMSVLASNTEYILLLNPDAFLFDDFIEKANEQMNSTEDCGVLTGTLYGYDIHKNTPTNMYDSTGIFQKWYGKWYDRDQRIQIRKQEENHNEEVPAACGALMFIRKTALRSCSGVSGCIFDPSFYMYKEDIDLSLRLKAGGWKTIYCPALKAYHCRGWALNRAEIPKKYRLISARNELRIHLRYKYIVGAVYSFIKLLAVKVLNR